VILPWLGLRPTRPQHDAVPADQRGVGVGDDVRLLQRDVAVADSLTGIGGEEVLDQEGHAAERTVGQVAVGGLTCMLEPADHDGVEGRVDALDAVDGGFEQLWR
jgi:hypothetical protein